MNNTEHAADLTARFRPSTEAIAAAVELCQTEVLDEAWVLVLLPGKLRGLWTAGQTVIALPFAYATRGEAWAAGDAVMAGQEGTYGYAAVEPDGSWAIFENR